MGPTAETPIGPSEDACAAVKVVDAGNGTPHGNGQHARSIYTVYGTRRKAFVVVLASVTNAVVLLSTMVFVPAIVAIQKDLGGTYSDIVVAIAAHMFISGATAMAWGPVCDKIGRRPSFLISTLIMLATAIGCAVCSEMTAFIVCRSIWGLAVGGLMVLPGTLVADAFAPSERGKWQAACAVPQLLVPIVGPLIGTALMLQFGWRSIFWMLTAVAGLMLLAGLFVFEETHHSLVLRRLVRDSAAARGSSPGTAATPLEYSAELQGEKGEGTISPETTCQAPWSPLKYLAELEVAPFVLVMVISSASISVAAIIIPGALASPPYSVGEDIIRYSLLPFGLGSLLTMPFGGLIADAAASRFSSHQLGRLLPGMVSMLAFYPPALALYGWLLQRGAGGLAAPLAVSGLLGVAECLYVPALFSYMTIVKQSNAASAAGLLQSTMLITTGILSQITPLGISTMQIGPFLSMLAGIQMLVAGPALWIIMQSLSRERQLAQQQVDGAFAA